MIYNQEFDMITEKLIQTNITCTSYNASSGEFFKADFYVTSHKYKPSKIIKGTIRVAGKLIKLISRVINKRLLSIKEKILLSIF